MIPTKKSFWLSYDLGLKGDYKGLYTFLDSVEAKECGDSVAFFKKDYTDNFLEELKNDLKNAMNLSATDRIYVIHSDISTKNVREGKGKFLFGGRKRSPWEGYAVKDSTLEEDN